MIYVDETEPDDGNQPIKYYNVIGNLFKFQLKIFCPEIEPPFEPRKVVVKNKEPQKEYNLGEELGRYVFHDLVN